MTEIFDLSLVLAIVAVAGVYLVRRHLRNRKSGVAGCGCGSDCSCCGQASSCSDPDKSGDLPMSK